MLSLHTVSWVGIFQLTKTETRSDRAPSKEIETHTQTGETKEKAKKKSVNSDGSSELNKSHWKGLRIGKIHPARQQNLRITPRSFLS